MGGNLSLNSIQLYSITVARTMYQEEPGFRRMPIIRARATKKNAELNAELKKMLN